MPRKTYKREDLPPGAIPLLGAKNKIVGFIDWSKTKERLRQQQATQSQNRLAAAIEQQNVHVPRIQEPPPKKDSYTLGEAVRYVKSQGKKYSESTLRRYADEHDVHVKRTPGKHIRFPKSTLDNLP